jgi:glycosyltransferase 2 family protein
MKKWTKYFVYISVAFLVFALWKADYLIVPEIDNYLFLAGSLVFLMAGYLTKSFVWTQTLKFKAHPIGYKSGVISVGLAELGKYIPGKLWIIFGRAGYVSENYSYKLKDTSYISFYTQILTIWTGLLIGAIGFLFIPIPEKWTIIFIAGFIMLTLVLFVPALQDLFLKLINKIFKKNNKLPVIRVNELLRLVPYYLFDWMIRITGFALLLAALSPDFFKLIFLPGYPLSITLGILAVIAPGGLGVREGVLFFWLHQGGLSVETATTISLVTRLWMLMGEILIFAFSFVLKRTSSKKENGKD